MFILLQIFSKSQSFPQLVSVSNADGGTCTTFSGDAGLCIPETDCDGILKGRLEKMDHIKNPETFILNLL